jgi:hypothetical protein
MTQSWRRTPRQIRWIVVATGVVMVALLSAVGVRAMGFGPTQNSALQVSGVDSGPTPMFQERLTTTRIGTSRGRTPPAVIPEGTITETPTGTSTVMAQGTATPDPSLEVSVISVKIEKKGSKADWGLSRASLKKATAKSGVLLSIYYTTASAGQSDVVGDQWTVTKNRKVVFRKGKSHRLGKPTSDLYRDYIGFKLGPRGIYVYTGRVTITGVSDAGRTNIRAVKRRKRR